MYLRHTEGDGRSGATRGKPKRPAGSPLVCSLAIITTSFKEQKHI